MSTYSQHPKHHAPSPTIQPAKRNATYQDILDAPENVNAQIIDGDLYLMPRPAYRHLWTLSKLGAMIESRVGSKLRGGPDDWVFLDEPELHLGNKPDDLIPDIAGWRSDRMLEPLSATYFKTTPDWVCEGLSPSTAKLDRGRKMDIYAREGVKHIWLIDPIAETLEIYQNVDGRWLRLAVHASDDIVRAEPFMSLEINLADLWLREPVDEANRP